MKPQEIQKINNIIMSTSNKKNQTLKSLFAGELGEKYFGKHVLLMDDQVHLLPTDGKKARQFIDDLKKQNPNQETELVFVPRPETYILWISK